MKKIYPKPFIFQLVTILILVATITVIHSCKKDKQEKLPVNTLTDPIISQAKAWYDSVYAAVNNNSKLATQSVGQKSTHDWSKRFFPDWAKANTYIAGGITYIELPATQVGNMAICFSKPKDTTKFDFSRSGSKTSLLIVKDQNMLSMYAMTIVAQMKM